MFMQLFDEYIWSFNVIRVVSQAHFGGGQFSEIYDVCSRIEAGDRESWHEQWKATAGATEAEAGEALAAGHTVSAVTRYSRACEYWRMADFLLAPDDPRRRASYDRSVHCFTAAMGAAGNGVERVEVPFEGTALPAWWVPGRGQKPGEKRPTVVFFGGADSTAEELYFTAPGITDRGLGCLIVDGPGQGGALRIGGIPSRYDYEVPVTAAVDYALTRPDVDTEALVLCSMSLGGYYAGRAAAFEHRFAATVIWGACYDYSEVWEKRPDDHPLADHMTSLFGTETIGEAREVMKTFSLRGILDQVRCPTLVIHGEDDRSVPVSHAQRTYDELTCEKELMLIPSGTPGSAHCQQDDLSMANELIFDWVLDRLDWSAPDGA
ncbi:MAG: prolyl oligopeptidase family serine peptidase [Actinobacteria bacterium]|nr:prolyl oligopeptidase family serine peptidase [Actinomycetota bacterium]